ncbi:hypothetical protein BDZ89DRAFT_1069512 [Hymenopellis radicata]|nr:hypothetical protein BDZ89DRAFT_1069512 [Hymenopellis radicata]
MHRQLRKANPRPQGFFFSTSPITGLLLKTHAFPPACPAQRGTLQMSQTPLARRRKPKSTAAEEGRKLGSTANLSDDAYGRWGQNGQYQ